MNRSPMMATDLIDHLHSQYGVAPHQATSVAEARLLACAIPLYLRLLIGVGVVVTGGMLLIALGWAGLFDSQWVMLIIGAITITAAVSIHRWCLGTNKSNVGFIVLQQISFLGIFVGKVLFVSAVAALGDWKNDELCTFIALTTCTLATYWLTDMYMDRLASCVATVISCLILLHNKMEMSEETLGLLSHWMLPLGLLIFIHPRVKQIYKPAGVALMGISATASAALILEGIGGALPWIKLFFPEFALHHVNYDFSLWALLASALASIISSGSLIALVIWACGGHNSISKPAVKLTIALTLILGVTCMTPVTIALIIIILGYVHHDRLLTLAGSLFLPVTLWLAIHNLRMGLLPTGIILVACGTIALLGYFAFRFWAFAEVADEQQMDLSLGVTTDA